MQSSATTVQQYIDELPPERKVVINRLRDIINKNLPPGFAEGIDYGMMGRSVPHSIYPAGYHVTPEIPLPFMGLASQKHFIALYHMGIYTDPALLQWFQTQYPKYAKNKLDMGKSCIRFKNINDIPYDLIGQLAGKITVAQRIKSYEQSHKK